ncbi:MAG: trimeric intracellular cation channel family protein [Anaerolineales bacterium]|nr:trimeric intracellular cation channel family protein [Anaerolineales bacterium]MCZ2121570.1 trimeric intracellular cation channel family protein [Anaerolineales bacterium]
MDNILLILTYLAVSAYAISGALEARKYQMDVVGATAIAFVAAFGGGTLRDLLLGRTPIFWITDPFLSIVTFALALISFYWLDLPSNRWLYVPDAIGLGVFSILGASYAMQIGASAIVTVLMGVITGSFGGVLRDLLCNQMPNLFRQKTELYATCSFIGTWIFVICTWGKVNSVVAFIFGAGSIFLLRLFAIRFKVTLPSP